MSKILRCLAVILFMAACKKSINPSAEPDSNQPSVNLKQGGSTGPTVTTTTASFITSATATSGGSVSSGGGGNNVTERGICYSTSPNPTTSNFKVISGSGSGSFTAVLLNLSGNTTYYVRAYAVKNSGTTYGNQVVFTTLTDYGTIIDFDGNIYHTITIGNQVWTVENWKSTHYNDGTVIPNVTDDNAWYALNSGAWCSYNNNDANIATYGRLYNWYAVNDVHGLAPPGWRVPTYTDYYTTLMNTLGGCNTAGKKLKDNIGWNGDNSSGFKALPAGRRYAGNGANGPVTFFSALGLYADWWTSTQPSNPAMAWYFEQGANDESCIITGTISDANYNIKTGYSVRFVKN